MASTKLVGPVVSDMRIAAAVERAIAIDNEGEPVILDQGAYRRIQLPGTCRLTQASLEEELGEAFTLSELERVMPSFSGRIRVSEDEIVWYLEGTR